MTKKKRTYQRLSLLFFSLALGLVAWNSYQDRRAQALSAQVLRNLVEERQAEGQVPVEEAGQELLVKEVDGVAFIGSLEIPKLDKELPVTRDWNQDLMKDYLNLYQGRTYEDPLIIMGHNYRSFLGDLDRLEKGDRVRLVDVLGRVQEYTLVAKEIIDGYGLGVMVNHHYPLTLFTCTLDGQSRLTLRFEERE